MLNQKAKTILKYLLIFSVVGVFVLHSTPFFALSEEQATMDAIKELQETAPDEAATYPLVIEYDDPHYGRRTKTIYFTISDINTAIKGDEVIDGQNAEVDAIEAITFTAADWIEVTNARAWNKQDGKAIPITKVDSSKIKMQPGTYPLVIETKKGTQTTVEITVVDQHVLYSTFWNDIYEWDTLLERIFYISGNILFIIIACLPVIYLLVEYTYLSVLTRNIKKLITKKF